MLELIQALLPSLGAVLLSSGFALSVMSGFRALEERIDWLAWESVEETMDLVENYNLPLSILRSKIRRTREFLKERPSARLLDKFVEVVT